MFVVLMGEYDPPNKMGGLIMDDRDALGKKIGLLR